MLIERFYTLGVERERGSSGVAAVVFFRRKNVAEAVAADTSGGDDGVKIRFVITRSYRQRKLNKKMKSAVKDQCYPARLDNVLVVS